MKKQVLKISFVLIIILSTLIATNNVVLGYMYSDTDMDDLINQGNYNGTLPSTDDYYQESELDAELKAQQGNMNIITPGTMVDSDGKVVETPTNGPSNAGTSGTNNGSSGSSPSSSPSGSTSASSMIDGINSYIGKNTSTTNSIFNTSNKILGAIEVIGTGIAIVMLIYIAIKYMLVAPEGKAEYKKTAIAYVVGAVILFAAPKLVKVIMEISQNVTGKL